MITHSSEPPRSSTARLPWFGLICIALAVFCGWSVVQLSPQKSLFASGPAAKVADWRLEDLPQFVESHTLVVVVGVGLALLWIGFRRSGSR